MNRRKALKTLLVGGVTAALIHPKSRKQVVRYGMKGFDVYRDTMIRFSEKKKLTSTDLVDFRARFNFASKKEEDEIVKQFLKDFQETRIRDRTFFRRKITNQELMKYIQTLSKKRKVFAYKHLTKASFEGKEFTKADVECELIRYFETNERIYRVPSQAEIRNVIDNGIRYKIN